MITSTELVLTGVMSVTMVTCVTRSAIPNAQGLAKTVIPKMEDVPRDVRPAIKVTCVTKVSIQKYRTGSLMPKAS